MNIFNIKEVIKITGLSRTTLWRYERTGYFPTRIKLGPNRIGYHQKDIEAWMESRPRVSRKSTNDARG